MSLDDLLSSSLESQVLGLLFVAPPRAFSQKELARRLSVAGAKLEPVLTVMVEQGELKTFSKKGIRYYLLNPKFELFGQIKDEILKNRSGFEDELVFAIRQLGKMNGAYLSGLFVGQPELPVDILLVGKVSPENMEQFVQGCEEMMGQEINYCLMTQAEFMERHNTFDRFIKDVFDHKHIVLLESGNNIARNT